MAPGAGQSAWVAHIKMDIQPLVAIMQCTLLRFGEQAQVACINADGLLHRTKSQQARLRRKAVNAAVHCRRKLAWILGVHWRPGA